MEIWAAVPAGVALGLPPLVVCAITIAGSLLSAAAVTITGGAFATWIARWRKAPAAPRSGRLHWVWIRYGVAGSGLVSRLVMAPAMGTAVALLLGAPPRRLLVWMSAGVMLWTAGLVVAATAGFDALHTLVRSLP